jgi:hypothetical protein
MNWKFVGQLQQGWFYPIRPYLYVLKKYLKNKAKLGAFMALGYIYDEALGLKNIWRILKIFNSNRALVIVVACCVLHNYYGMWKIPKPSHLNDVIPRDYLPRFRIDQLPTLRYGQEPKQIGYL